MATMVTLNQANNFKRKLIELITAILEDIASECDTHYDADMINNYSFNLTNDEILGLMNELGINFIQVPVTITLDDFKKKYYFED